MPPRPKPAAETTREERMRAMFKAGASMDQVARRFGLTRTQIEDVIRRSHFPLLEDDHAEDHD